ncbi:RagB/SusD family nutrient uptake outer membrane protein [Pedobacter sp. MC2016-14]|uniref:RagB/SusD family nutrient uptake outer membrane protein n=1 Tax=Pedobacter sp. MC2016-14 TaxID=2897327 RepID=UPI001E476DC6|nr:RagB/SusD family nutrient uptake outer membrane protein [Pedobacter sp. MC2016-14]MCD0488087.1 RagB/SusD family nutrient uptake outer membrane protein [Pedobacter sp. MC2016-14]
MNIFKIAFIAVITMTLLSCRKYVEKVPVQGQRVLVYTSDYRLLMNNIVDSEVGSGNAAVLSSDDLDMKDPGLQQYFSGDITNVTIYTWRKPFYVDKMDDYDWNAMYKSIFTYNIIIAGVLDSKGGSADERNAIYAEALIQRAYTYFTLVNSYGKQYDAATAATDLGVPLLLEAKLFVNLERATVAQVYAQVFKDLEVALPLISVAQVNSVRPNKAALYALLAKIYLNMRNFSAAQQAAEQSLALTSTLYDYKNFVVTPKIPFPKLTENKEVLLRKVARINYSALQLSDDLLNLLGTKDFRYTLFTKDGSTFWQNFSGKGYWAGNGTDASNVGLSVSETWLIRAECLARAGRRDDAVKMLNDLRKLRFRSTDYVDLVATSDQQALEMVINERRREFFGTGLRWFDQRRLNKDPFFAKTRTRTYQGATYTLEPNSNAYVFPFSSLIVNQNPELVQNPN